MHLCQLTPRHETRSANTDLTTAAIQNTNYSTHLHIYIHLWCQQFTAAAVCETRERMRWDWHCNSKCQHTVDHSSRMQQKFLQQCSTVAVIIIITVSAAAEASIKLVIKWLIVESSRVHVPPAFPGCWLCEEKGLVYGCCIVASHGWLTISRQAVGEPALS